MPAVASYASAASPSWTRRVADWRELLSAAVDRANAHTAAMFRNHVV